MKVVSRGRCSFAFARAGWSLVARLRPLEKEQAVHIKSNSSRWCLHMGVEIVEGREAGSLYPVERWVHELGVPADGGAFAVAQTFLSHSNTFSRHPAFFECSMTRTTEASALLGIDRCSDSIPWD